MKTLLAFLALGVLTANFAWAEETSGPPDGQARVRFFGQAVLGLSFYKNKTCYGGKGVSASRAGFGGAFGSKKNITLGMPETPTVLNLKQRDGILASAFYREYAVNAGEPLTIMASYQANPGRYIYSCKNFGIYFIPENGKDYEVTLDVDSQICRLSVNRIESNATSIELVPVGFADANKCSDME
jgi:hypothetical protein